MRQKAVLAIAVIAAWSLPLSSANASFPGEPGKIAFMSQRDGGDWDIFTMNPSGRGLAQLTVSTAQDMLPNWSADGVKIVFDSNRDGNFEIYVMNADGTGQTRLTNDPALTRNRRSHLTGRGSCSTATATGIPSCTR